MNIFANSVVTLTFKLYTSDGKLIETSDEPISYLHGGYSGIFPKIEDALNGKAVGDKVSVTLEPADAFGDYDPQLMRLVDVSELPPDIAVGGFLTSDQSDRVWRVTNIADGKAVIDGNHELAGIRMLFEGTVTAVREATEEEVEHGHTHEGHHHHDDACCCGDDADDCCCGGEKEDDCCCGDDDCHCHDDDDDDCCCGGECSCGEKEPTKH